MQTELALEFPKPSDSRWVEACAAPDSSAWVESWHNHSLPFGKLNRDQQASLMDETARWLFKGRRWPLNPSERQHQHALHWWARVAQIMRRHGWELSWKEDDHLGYTVTWTLSHAPEHHVSGCGPSAPFAAITSAAICRRKARYYGLWQNSLYSYDRPP